VRKLVTRKQNENFSKEASFANTQAKPKQPLMKKRKSYSVAIVMQQAKYISRKGESNQMYRCACKLIDLLSTTLMNTLNAHDI